ncbi:DNA repair protein RadC [Pantoea sp. DY-15]|uniref:JAB domain-containing protein n=1 Tax=Pantoea sp. DY-15 TaxID=2871489 RepID=UPI001C96E96C|nr:DNA repair protein RadC [Pantoea sp. DY-15]MBY4890606.1 DNA repair protein RadC [Pantoea sp. DY-15]
MSGKRFYSKLYTIADDGKFKNASMQAVMQEANRVIEFKYQKGTEFKSAHIAKEYLKTKLAAQEREVFSVIYLNAHREFISYSELFLGTLTLINVHPREIARQALKLNADAVIISHNHPSGNAQPSAADMTMTQRIISTLAVLDIKVLDHIIVAGNDAVSFAEHEYL